MQKNNPNVRDRGYGPVELLIFQGTPFCNIDCKYCYLPDRQNKKRISLETVEITITKALSENLIGDRLDVVWHAGEPLVLPSEYYTKIFERINNLLPSHIVVCHHIQTNAMLINQEWCEVFKKFNVRVGVSIDGPQYINDLNRVTRTGQSTFDRVLNGINYLKLNTITFHVIAVVSKQALQYAEEIFYFFQDLGTYLLALNIEELEGSNDVCSMVDDVDTKEQVFNFFSVLNKLNLESEKKFLIREFDSVRRAILRMPLNYFAEISLGQLTRPWGVINVDCDGNFSTFSPELLGQKSELYNDFTLGNIHSTTFREAYDSQKFQKMLSDIIAGIEKCRKKCDYFSLCGGGTPSNKYYENGTFDSGETTYCKYTKQIPIDVVLKSIESKIVALNL